MNLFKNQENTHFRFPLEIILVANAKGIARKIIEKKIPAQLHKEFRIKFLDFF